MPWPAARGASSNSRDRSETGVVRRAPGSQVGIQTAPSTSALARTTSQENWVAPERSARSRLLYRSDHAECGEKFGAAHRLLADQPVCLAPS